MNAPDDEVIRRSDSRIFNDFTPDQLIASSTTLSTLPHSISDDSLGQEKK